MEKRTFQTPLGEIWLMGEPAAFEDDRPLLLALPGVFASTRNKIFQLQGQLPQAAVLLTQLPGHTCPSLAETSVKAFAAAFDHVFQAGFAGRRVMACGESVGGLVAMAMATPGLVRLALDPPLRTGKLWPAIPTFRKLYDEHPDRRLFLENVLGVTGAAVEDRDYRGLVDRPARVLVGSVPLMPQRDLAFQPSFVDEPERQLLRDNPRVQMTEVEGVGHVVLQQAPGVVLRVLQGLLDTA